MCVDLEHVLVVLPGFQPRDSAQPSGVTPPHLAFMEDFFFIPNHFAVHSQLTAENMHMSGCVISWLLGGDVHGT